MVVEENWADWLLILLMENGRQVPISPMRSNRQFAPLFLQLCNAVKGKKKKKKNRETHALFLFCFFLVCFFFELTQGYQLELAKRQIFHVVKQLVFLITFCVSLNQAAAKYFDTSCELDILAKHHFGNAEICHFKFISLGPRCFWAKYIPLFQHRHCWQQPWNR